MTDARGGGGLIAISAELAGSSGLTHRLLGPQGRNLAATPTRVETTQETTLASVAGVANSGKGDTRMSDQEPTQAGRQP